MELVGRIFNSFMEFHGIWTAPISLTRAVLRNSMEFHGITWKLGCTNFADTSNSMEFHGTWSVLIPMARAVPWNSMELVERQFRWHEQFHGIPRNSMQLGLCQFRWHEQFHGIPWNLDCGHFDDTFSSMEFHGTSLVIKYIKFEVAWILVEFEACIIPTEMD